MGFMPLVKEALMSRNLDSITALATLVSAILLRCTISLVPSEAAGVSE